MGQSLGVTSRTSVLGLLSGKLFTLPSVENEETAPRTVSPGTHHLVCDSGSTSWLFLPLSHETKG